MIVKSIEEYLWLKRLIQCVPAIIALLLQTAVRLTWSVPLATIVTQANLAVTLSNGPVQQSEAMLNTGISQQVSTIVMNK